MKDRGCVIIRNTETGRRRRHPLWDPVPDGWMAEAHCPNGHGGYRLESDIVVVGGGFEEFAQVRLSCGCEGMMVVSQCHNEPFVELFDDRSVEVVKALRDTFEVKDFACLIQRELSPTWWGRMAGWMKWIRLRLRL